jgi:hypothetical protein
MGPDDPEDTNPGGLDVDYIVDEQGVRRLVVRDDHGVSQLADEVSGLSEAARRRAQEEGFPGA